MELEPEVTIHIRPTSLLLLVLAATFLTFGILIAAPSQGIEIVACGTVIPPGETGVLTSDLDCSSPMGAFGVELNDLSTLDLNGHTITGGVFGVQGAFTTQNRVGAGRARCHILSSVPGGAIVGSLFGISDCDKTEVSDVAVIGATIQAIGGPRLVLTNVTIRDGAEPITTATLEATNLVVTNNRGVTQMNRGVIRGLIATGNTGPWFLRSFKHSSLVLTDATITGNTGVGVIGERVTLKNSTVTGNNTTAQVIGGGETVDGIDLISKRKPRLINSTCGRSAQLSVLSNSWGVCANDPP